MNKKCQGLKIHYICPLAELMIELNHNMVLNGIEISAKIVPIVCWTFAIDYLVENLKLIIIPYRLFFCIILLTLYLYNLNIFFIYVTYYLLFRLKVVNSLKFTLLIF